MKLPQNESARTATGMGLAFFFGCFAFIVTFLIMRHFTGGPEAMPLIPPNQRKPAAVSMLHYRNADGSAPASSAEKWSLEDQPSQIVLVNYFATWCPPCRQEMPALMKLAAEYAPRGVAFVAISIDSPEGVDGKSREQIVQQFLTTIPVTIPMLVPGPDADLWKSPNPFPIPQTFIYDKQHRRAQEILGQIDETTIRTSLDTLLKE